MNIWTKKSIELSSQKNYLDLLYEIYPMGVNLKRELSGSIIEDIKTYYANNEDVKLLKLLLKQKLFPIKDSYVAYLRKNKDAVENNPKTVARITGIIRTLGIEEILERIAAPKETNRQIGPLFKQWLKSDNSGFKTTTNQEELLNSKDNLVFDANDAIMEQFAKEHLGYNHDKGLDFVGKFNGKYVIAEAKFLSDRGGHQNAQFNDAVSTMRSKLEQTDETVIKIAILDGVVYLPGENKFYKSITSNFNDEEVIISAVLLRDYLNTL